LGETQGEVGERHTTGLRPIALNQKYGSGAKWRGPIGYADQLSWSKLATSKLKIAEELFKGRPFERGIVILWVRWYLRYKLSLRDLVEMMAERGLSMAHTTIMRWVQR
jgi:hypothetical protein